MLDTPPERVFDHITELAASICGTYIALVSLVDDSRQWFKSVYGRENVKSTSKDIAFCRHAIILKDIMEVADAKKDLRFLQNSLVLASPYIRFYAGQPSWSRYRCRERGTHSEPYV